MILCCKTSRNCRGEVQKMSISECSHFSTPSFISAMGFSVKFISGYFLVVCLSSRSILPGWISYVTDFIFSYIEKIGNTWRRNRKLSNHDKTLLSGDLRRKYYVQVSLTPYNSNICNYYYDILSQRCFSEHSSFLMFYISIFMSVSQTIIGIYQTVAWLNLKSRTMKSSCNLRYKR